MINVCIPRVAPQGYTQFGGQRPFGVSLLYGGWDEHYGFQLYQSDPSGNYGGWKAVAIGAGAAPGFGCVPCFQAMLHSLASLCSHA